MNTVNDLLAFLMMNKVFLWNVFYVFILWYYLFGFTNIRVVVIGKNKTKDYLLVNLTRYNLIESNHTW